MLLHLGRTIVDCSPSTMCSRWKRRKAWMQSRICFFKVSCL